MLVHRHCWVWTALPADARKVHVLGDPDLAGLLAEAGMELVGAPAADAPLVVDADDGRLPPAVLDLPPGAHAAIAGLGGSSVAPSYRSKGLRTLELAGDALALGPTLARLGQARRALKARGLRSTATLTGDRSRVYGLGSGSLARLRRPARGWILRAGAGAIPPSYLDAALATAAAGLGAHRDGGAAVMHLSGKLTLPLGSPDGRLMLRLAGGPPREVLERGVDVVSRLARARPQLTRFLARSLHADRVGPVAFTIEPLLDGHHPGELDDRLRADAVAFLVDLHGADEVRTAPEPELRERFAGQAALLAPYVGQAERALLDALSARLGQALADVPLGRMHGDFWNESILVRGGRLRGVIDWDWSSADALPGLDLLDLLALGHRATRALDPGRRLREMLWPLVHQGGGRELHDYGAALGFTTGPRTVAALIAAHWLDRTSRVAGADGGRDPRLRQRSWVESNVEDPLRFLVGREPWPE